MPYPRLKESPALCIGGDLWLLYVNDDDDVDGDSELPPSVRLLVGEYLLEE